MKQRKDGRWVKKIKLPNGTSKFFYSSENTEKKALKDIENQLLNYKHEEISKNNFSKVAETWANETFDKLENNSLKVYKPACRECIEYFKDKNIQDITPSDVKNFVTSYEKRGFSPKTIKNKLLVLNLICKYAIIEQYISHNPCQLITVKTPQKTQKRHSLDTESISIIRNSVNEDFGLFAFFLLYTGLRRGEAFALTPKDIDFENKTIHVNKTVEWLGNVPQIKPCPKTEAGNREVPIPDILIEHLQKLKNNTYLFQNENGEMMHNSQVTRMWNKYIKKTNLNATPHILRHTYATMLFDAGIDVKTAQSWLGHTDIKTTLDIYTHLSEQRKEKSISKWQAYLTTF